MQPSKLEIYKIRREAFKANITDIEAEPKEVHPYILQGDAVGNIQPIPVNRSTFVEPTYTIE